MEIWNTGCAMGNDMDTDAAYWDELLGKGIRIFGVATDDGHGANQHCKGWVRVNAENNVNSILAALKEGNFYSSTGPEIYGFSVDDEGNISVDCSEAVKVRFHSDCHPTKIVRSAEGMTHAELKIDISQYAYIRVSVVDKDGKKAWTNPIFFD
jgi:hypothetical protein